MNTKDRIMLHSLWLFSQRGYDAVSIRDICKVVGIRESTIYYYFKNKQHLMDTLKEFFTATANSMKKRQLQTLDSIVDLNRDDLIRITDFYLEQYLMEPFVNQFCRILMIEQGNDACMRELYHQWFFEFPVEFHTKLFQRLIKNGYFKESESSYLAISFYTPIFFYYQQFLGFGNMEDKNKEDFFNSVHSYMDKFLEDNEAPVEIAPAVPKTNMIRVSSFL